MLDVGSFIGLQTQLIEAHDPKSMTLLEPDANAISGLRGAFQADNVDFVCEDLFLYLEKPRKFDVVVMCGVLYHFHSPIYALELIANRISPEYLLLETFCTGGGITSHYEDDGMPGYRQIAKGWKSAKIGIKIDKETIIQSMENLGYKLEVCDTTIIKNGIPPVFFVFKKI